MLDENQQDILLAELIKPDYDNMTSDEAWHYLYDAQALDGKEGTHVFTAADLYSVIKPASSIALLNWVNLSLVMAAIDRQDRPALRVWSMALQLASILDAEDAAAIVNLISLTDRAYYIFYDSLPDPVEFVDFDLIFSQRAAVYNISGTGEVVSSGISDVTVT